MQWTWLFKVQTFNILNNFLKSLFDISGDTDYSQVVTKPMNLSFLLKYILETENESPKNLVSLNLSFKSYFLLKYKFFKIIIVFLYIC